MGNRILVTGQFWDQDFADLINRLNVPTTLIAAEKLETVQSLADTFDLTIIAQNRRESIAQSLVEHIRELTKDVPIINLLGSFCEGQERSGKPLQNVVPIYWHQWSGKFDQLLAHVQLQVGESEGLSTGLLSLEFLERGTATIGISALCESQYSFLDDSVTALGLNSCWLEKAIWDAQATGELSAICVDCDLLSEDLYRRLDLLHADFADIPKILILSYPRKGEIKDFSERYGIQQVVSKPYTIAQMAFALTSATGIELVTDKALPQRFHKHSNPEVEGNPTIKFPTKLRAKK